LIPFFDSYFRTLEKGPILPPFDLNSYTGLYTGKLEIYVQSKKIPRLDMGEDMNITIYLDKQKR